MLMKCSLLGLFLIGISLSSVEAQGFRQMGTRRGAVTGAVIGGLIGGQNDEVAAGIIAGGLVGGVTGRVIGNNMDARANQHYNSYPQPYGHQQNYQYSQPQNYGHPPVYAQQNYANSNYATQNHVQTDYSSHFQPQSYHYGPATGIQSQGHFQSGYGNFPQYAPQHRHGW